MEGSKGQISFNFNYQVNFKDFLFQTLCAFSQMKDTKHIRQGFILSPGSCSRGGTWGYLGAKIKFCPSVMLSPPKPLDEVQPNLVCE